MFTPKTILARCGLGLIGIAACISARAETVYYEEAQVIAVSPQTERINTPQRECHTEYFHDSSAPVRSLTGPLIGGIAGGLLGSRVGKGDGRVAGAAAGAAIGAIVGDRMGHGEPHRATRPVEHCSVVDQWQTVNRGYRVTYRLHGYDHTTTLGYDPGSVLRVRVIVVPVSGA